MKDLTFGTVTLLTLRPSAVMFLATPKSVNLMSISDLRFTTNIFYGAKRRNFQYIVRIQTDKVVLKPI